MVYERDAGDLTNDVLIFAGAAGYLTGSAWTKIGIPTDIALMKWTLSQRAAGRFYDLYFLCQKDFPGGLIMKVPQKYPEKKINHYHMIKPFLL